MRLVHVANAVAWFAQALLWAFYATPHVIMALLAFAIAIGSAIYAKRAADAPWRYR